MNSLWKIIKRLKGLFFFFLILASFCVLVMIGGFITLKYYGPISSKVVAGFIEAILERNIESAKIEIGEIGLALESNIVNVTVVNFKVTYDKNIVILPYIKTDINVISVMKGNIIEALSNTNISSDIEIIRIPNKSSKTTIKRSNKNIAKSLKNSLFNNIDVLNRLPNLLRGINFNISSVNKKNVLNVKLNNLNFELVKNYIFHFQGDFSAGDDFISIYFDIDVANDNVLKLNGKVDFIPLSLLWVSSEYYDKIESNLKLDFVILGEIGSRGLKQLNFDLVNHRGLIQKNEYISRDFVPKKIFLSLKLLYRGVVDVSSLIEADDLHIQAAFINKGGKLLGDIAFNQMQLKTALGYWPLFLLEDIRKWLGSHLDKGYISGMNVRLNIDFNELAAGKDLERDAIKVVIGLENSTIKYMPLPYVVPPINIEIGEVLVSAHDVVINLQQASILNSSITHMSGIIDYHATQVNLNLNGILAGPVQDVIDLGFSHANVNNHKLKHFNGRAITEVKIIIPLDKEIVLNDETINITSNLQNVSHKNFLDLTEFSITGRFIGTKLKLDGQGKINKVVNTDFYLEKDLSKVDSAIKTDLKIKASTAELRKHGLLSSNFINGDISGNIEIFLLDNKYDINTSFDLEQLSIIHPIGIEKKVGERGNVSFSLNGVVGKDLINISKYSVILPVLSSSGRGMLNGTEIVRLLSEESQINGSDFGFKYKKNYRNCSKLYIYGNKINLHKINALRFLTQSNNNTSTIISDSGVENNGSFELNVDFKNIVLQQGQILFAPKVSLFCRAGKCREFRLSGRFFDDTKINVFYSYPVLSIVSDSTSKALSAFGIYDKMEGGRFELKGEFNSNDIFKGNVTLFDFYIKKAPLLAKLISPLTSFRGLKDILNNKGIYFKKMRAGIAFDKTKFFLDGLVLTGPTLHIKCSAVLNQKSDKITGEGIIVPSNIINVATKNIPLIGKVISGGEDGGIIATNFSLYGDVHNIGIGINPLSILMPGFLGSFFNKETSFKKKEKSFLD